LCDSLHGTEIVIQPIECFFEPRGEWEPVSGFQHDLALVCRGSTEEAEERLLGRFEWRGKIVPTIDHEYRDFDVRREISRIDFWWRFPMRRKSAIR
jgi:hypothetical protein